MIDTSVLRLARTQHGLVSRSQLTALGVSSARIRSAVSREQLLVVIGDVFLVSPASDTFEMRCRAVQLCFQDCGFIAGPTAGRLYGLAQLTHHLIHYTIPLRRHRPMPTWVGLHRTVWYDEHNDRRTDATGLIVATPLRMLFGLAALLDQRRFDNAADDAWHNKLITLQAVDTYLHQHRCRGKDGVAKMERWLERAIIQERPAQSYFERDLIDALCDAGLPMPERQFRVELRAHHAVKIDISWPELRLGIEPGHSRFHQGADAVERDTLRDLACAEVGWEIHRLTDGARSDLASFARRLRLVHMRRSLDLRADRRGPLPPPPPTSPSAPAAPGAQI